MVIWNLAWLIIIPVCVALDMLDFICLIFFPIGHMESRRTYNYHSLCRLCHARFLLNKQTEQSALCFYTKKQRYKFTKDNYPVFLYVLP